MHHPPLCSDFVIELRSDTDRLSALKDKMREYIENGAQLGWLIDPIERRVWVSPNADEERLDNPAMVSGDPELPGYVIPLNRVWR
jgi:Uma2 family endonuclease